MISVYFNKELPFRHFSFRFFDTNDQESLSILVKGIFKIDETERLLAFRDKPTMTIDDVFSGSFNQSSLKIESDLAPFKPKTDLVFNAVARSPEEKLLESWPIRFDVDRQFSYGFHVFGERQFEPFRKNSKVNWQLSEIKAIKECPLHYEHAFGGTILKAEDELASYPYNPIGTGLVSDYILSEGKEPIKAPQLGSMAELNNLQLGDTITIHGCGPITKSWLPRIAFAGTLDDAWLRERHPLMPKDFNDAYWNSAPLPLQISPYLKGNETITVRGLLHEPQPYSFTLPGAGIGARIKREGSLEIENVALNLDTVYCDIASINKEDHRITLIWRIRISNPETIAEVILHPRSLNENNTQLNDVEKKDIERRENEEARQELIKEKQRSEALIKENNMTWSDLAFIHSASPAMKVAGKVPALLFIDPVKKNPIIVGEETKQLLCVGKPDYLFEDLDYPSRTVLDPSLNLAKALKIDEDIVIYVPLQDVPIKVWRPVHALWHGDDLYYIHLNQQPHSGENWQFKPNQKVICEWREFKDGVFLVAKQLFSFR